MLKHHRNPHFYATDINKITKAGTEIRCLKTRMCVIELWVDEKWTLRFWWVFAGANLELNCRRRCTPLHSCSNDPCAICWLRQRRDVEQVEPCGRVREWAMLGVDHLSWLLSNTRLGVVHFVRRSSQFMTGVISSYAVVWRKELGSRCFNSPVVIFKNVGILQMCYEKYCIRDIRKKNEEKTNSNISFFPRSVTWKRTWPLSELNAILSSFVRSSYDKYFLLYG